MPLDGIFLHCLKDELKSSLIGSRVDKIHQPSRDELLFVMRTRNGAMKVIVSASANSPRVHITKNAPENPEKPPMLCMLMRKHLSSASLVDLKQDGLDRTLRLMFEGSDNVGDKTKLSLYVEIMAKHSNIILVNDSDGRIIDAVKRVDLTQSSYRQVLPGCKYISPPPQDKINLINASVRDALDAVLSMKDKRLSSALLASLEGVSPLISREIAEITGGDNAVSEICDAQKQRLLERISELKELIVNISGSPYCFKDSSGRLKDFSYMDITQYGFALTGEKAESFSELLDSFYHERDRLDRTRQRAADLFKLLSNAQSRAAKKTALRQKELSDCADRESLRIKAELINANLGSLSKGAAFYDVENYYDSGKTLRIKCDPSLSPAANAQKYYKEYRKAKTAEQMLTSLIESGMQEEAYLETVADSLARSSSEAEIEAIRDELKEAGYLKRKSKGSNKSLKALPPIEYTSPDGFKILVGRNNIQNDKLSLKTAKGGDLWLHAQKIPGSHVIVVSNGEDIPDSTIEYAAAVAAYHSKGRESTQVEVDYTLAKRLKKPQGARPGKVIYHVYNSISVKPYDGK